MLYTIKITWKIISPFHISFGHELGGYIPSIDFIPATTIKGALLFEYIRRYCINDKFSICTQGGDCEKCGYPFLDNKDNQALSGGFFETIKLQNKMISNRWGISIEGKTKTAKDGALFNYETCYDREGLSSQIFIIDPQNMYKNEVNNIVDIISDGIYIGKHKSSGFGYIKGNCTVNEFNGMKEFVNNYIEQNLTGLKSDFVFEIRKPVPLYTENPSKQIKKRFGDLFGMLDLEGGKFDIQLDTAVIGKLVSFKKPGSTIGRTKNAINRGKFRVNVESASFADHKLGWQTVLTYCLLSMDEKASHWYHATLNSGRVDIE